MQLPKINTYLDFEKQLAQVSLFEQLKQQLIKDFNTIGLYPELEQTANPKAFYEELTRVIQYLVEQRFGDFLNLLYRIDISETKIKLHIAQAEENVIRDITLLILQREYQKVWLKLKYS